jgi:hypothetical protein
MADQLSLDDQAAQMAEQMSFPGSGGPLAKGGGAGGMPAGRGGNTGAEGGFTTDAGGKLIDADAQKGGAVDDSGMALGKAGAYTGSDMTSEPGRQGMKPYTGDKVTSEPKAESGGGSGEGGNLAQGGDEGMRARKPGKIGGMGDGGAEGGKNLSEDEDDSTRKRKAGKVGMAKAGVEEEKDEDEDMDKSFDAADLIKSLKTLEAISQGSTVQAPAERRAELATKLEDGTLSKSEMIELSELMKASVGGAPEDSLAKSGAADDDEVEDEEDFAKSHQDQFADDPEMKEAYEVSNFLERHSQLTAAALDRVEERLGKSLEGYRDHSQAFNTQLAKSLMGMAQLAQRQDGMIKSLVERLETVENTPLPRRGVASGREAQVLAKSMEGEVGAGSGASGLTGNQVMDALEQMAMRGIQQTPSGHRIDYAIAQIEHDPGQQIAKSLYNDVATFIQQNSGSVRVQ